MSTYDINNFMSNGRAFWGTWKGVRSSDGWRNMETEKSSTKRSYEIAVRNSFVW